MHDFRHLAPSKSHPAVVLRNCAIVWEQQCLSPCHLMSLLSSIAPKCSALLRSTRDWSISRIAMCSIETEGRWDDLERSIKSPRHGARIGIAPLCILYLSLQSQRCNSPACSQALSLLSARRCTQPQPKPRQAARFTHLAMSKVREG